MTRVVRLHVNVFLIFLMLRDKRAATSYFEYINDFVFHVLTVVAYKLFH